MREFLTWKSVLFLTVITALVGVTACSGELGPEYITEPEFCDTDDDGKDDRVAVPFIEQDNDKNLGFIMMPIGQYNETDGDLGSELEFNLENTTEDGRIYETNDDGSQNNDIWIFLNGNELPLKTSMHLDNDCTFDVFERKNEILTISFDRFKDNNCDS